MEQYGKSRPNQNRLINPFMFIVCPGGGHASSRPRGYAPESETYIDRAIPSCRRLLLHRAFFPEAFARATAGNNNDARIAMIAIVTYNSINVNASRDFLRAFTDHQNSGCGLLSRYHRARAVSFFAFHAFVRAPSSC